MGGKEYRLRGLDVFQTFPNELHSTGANPEEKSILYYMIVDTVHDQENFLGIGDPRIAYIPRTLNSLPIRQFRGSEKISSLWETIYGVYDSDHPIRETIMRMYMLELFLEIIRCASQSEINITPDIERAAAYIREHTSEYMTIETLAGISGLSASRFKAKFRHQMGMPPGEYIQRERISRAKQLLKEGRSITYIAHELDYSSSQHFSNTFKKFAGISPSEYRKKH